MGPAAAEGVELRKPGLGGRLHPLPANWDYSWGVACS